MENGQAAMTEQYKLNTASYQAKGREQFAQQTGVCQGPCMLFVGLVRKPLLIARLAFLRGKKLRRAVNERQYAVDCALRAFTHFNPRYGYCAKSECLRCKCEIDDTANISIVMLALPPWTQKSDTPKTAMMAGFFCAACDIRDDEAEAIWRAAVKEQGIEIASTNAGHA
jgi:hypothetical protein